MRKQQTNDNHHSDANDNNLTRKMKHTYTINHIHGLFPRIIHMRKQQTNDNHHSDANDH